jgi:hypothetical protein
MVMRMAAITATVVLLASACSSNAERTADTDAANFQAVLSCEALAGRWIDSQQLFLDDIGDISTIDYDASDDVVSRAKQRLGAAVIEQARDAELAGCTAELKPGSDPLCEGIARLESRGPAGDEFLGALQQPCN